MVTSTRGRLRPRGFSRIEVLIVMFVGGISLGTLVGCVQRVRDGDRTQCVNNLKMIALAIHSFESTFKRMPPLYGGSNQFGVVNSLKFPNVWGSTHVFLLPYIEQDRLYRQMAIGAPPDYDPTFAGNGGPANLQGVWTFACPGDPTMTDDKVIKGGTYGGTSYAANAQVFAPLVDETITGGGMHPSSKPDFTDRGAPLARLQDGTSTIIMITHSYAVCGSANSGTAWGYGAGVNQSPSAVNTFQPWSRASYLGQTFLTPAGRTPFQVQPNSYLTKCSVTEPATPHIPMLVALADASVRGVASNVSPDTWIKACLPSDGYELPADWDN